MFESGQSPWSKLVLAALASKGPLAKEGRLSKSGMLPQRSRSRHNSHASVGSQFPNNPLANPMDKSTWSCFMCPFWVQCTYDYICHMSHMYSDSCTSHSCSSLVTLCAQAIKHDMVFWYSGCFYAWHNCLAKVLWVSQSQRRSALLQPWNTGLENMSSWSGIFMVSPWISHRNRTPDALSSQKQCPSSSPRSNSGHVCHAQGSQGGARGWSRPEQVDLRIGEETSQKGDRTESLTP